MSIQYCFNCDNILDTDFDAEHFSIKCKKFSTLDKQELDSFISDAVKNHELDKEKAKKMSYQDKQDYFNWSEYMANNR